MIGFRMGFLSALIGSSAAATAQAPASQFYKLDIPRERLAFALADFARETGLQVARFSDAGEPVTISSPVVGVYTAVQALELILSGSGYGFRFVNDRTVAIIRIESSPPASKQDSPSVPPTTSSTPTAAPSIRSHFVSRLTALLVALGSGAVFGQGQSQADTQGGSELQEVVVTAQRRSERLQDVPISVAAFSAGDLAAAAITGISDLPNLTPGFVFGSQAGFAQPFLRGVGTVAIGPGIENPIAIYVDGVYYGASASGIMAFNNIQQVEVDKGPQGTLFGRNATGGLIQVTTKTPSDTFGGTISATYGNYATAGTDFYVTGGVTSNLDADLAVHFQHQGDGYGVNVLTGEAVGYTQDLAARNKWLLKTSDGTQLTLILDYGVTHFVPNYTAAPGTSALGAPANPVSSQDLIGLFPPSGDTHQGGASLHIDQDFDDFRFISITAYRRTVIDVDAAAQLTADPEFSIKNITYLDNEQLSQEFQVQSLPGSRINWTGGTYLYDDDAGSTPPSVTTGGLIAPLTYLAVYDHQKAYSAALYGQATTEVAASTNLTVGLRYTVERRDFRGEETFGFPGGASQIIPDAEKKIFDKPTWRLALDHHFSSDVMGFVSYNRGFKSGGFNDALFPTVEFSPETLDAYEIGEKATVFDRHLSLDSSAFLYNYKNIQAFQYFENGDAFVYNAGAARLYGLDFDAKWKFTESFSLTAGVEGLHTNYTSFPTAAISTPAEGGGTAYTIGSAKGNHLPFSPTATASLTADYLIPLATFGELNLSTTYSYSTGFFGEPDNRLHQAAYHVVNAQVAWESLSKLYDVRLWGRNMTNSEYASALGSQPNGDFAVFEPPRTYGVTVSRNF
jgi:iron complex outermembrane receptor protein